jgi:glutamyl/glutaminyl-tRNA synthetase
MMRGIISRFAPAPTGYLHLGHVVNAIYVWGLVRQHAGRVLLRIEDHDRARSRAEFEAAILEDLQWLGFSADAPAVRQSDRDDIYCQAISTLRQQGLVFVCTCSRAAIAAATRTIPSDVGSLATDELWYPGTCRHKNLTEKPGVGLRIQLAPTVEHFVDLRHGPIDQQPSAQCGDLLARDRDGNWTYQFAAAVDDYHQGVTLVIRGDDLLASTGRQLQLARLLGRVDPPQFLHHALVMKAATQKLSKSDGDTGVRDLRARGWTPARVIGHAAMLAGLLDRERPVSADSVAEIVT